MSSSPWPASDYPSMLRTHRPVVEELRGELEHLLESARDGKNGLWEQNYFPRHALRFKIPVRLGGFSQRERLCHAGFEPALLHET